VVFVDPDPVVAELIGELEFVEVPLVVLSDLDRVAQLHVGWSDPDALVSLFEVARQISIGHQMEEDRLHV